MTKLTDNQKKIIEKLGHPVYNGEYVEKWLNQASDVNTNAPAALIAMGACGFMDAIEAIEKAYPETRDETNVRITKYEPGMEDGHECTIPHCGRFDVDCCDECDWNNHMPFVVDSLNKKIHVGNTAYIVDANGKRYVINEDLAKAIANNITDIFKVAGLDVSKDGDGTKKEDEKQP